MARKERECTRKKSRKGGKEELAELYKSFGMTIFYDLVGRAKRNQDLADQLRQTQAETDRIKEEIIQNRYSADPGCHKVLIKIIPSRPCREKSGRKEENIMEQQIISEADKRMKSYVEALMRCENARSSKETGDCISEEISIVRRGDIVSIIRRAGETIDCGTYNMSKPALVKRYVDRHSIEFEGIRYNASELQPWNGKDVQVVKIGNMLHMFDLDGMGITSIEI